MIWNTSDKLPDSDDVLCVVITCDSVVYFAFYIQGCEAWDSPDVGWVDNEHVLFWAEAPASVE